MAQRESDERRKSYSPPEITRVVLRSEQAVLSVCSLSTPSSEYLDLAGMCTPVCRKEAAETTGDESGTS